MRNEKNAARVVKAARGWLGTPYIHQSSLKQVGCDCLGLVRGVWREVEGGEPQSTPAYSSAWSEVGGSEQLLHAAMHHFEEVAEKVFQPGDLLLFRMRRMSVAKHLGISSSPSKFIHSYEGNSVVESSLSNFWSARVAAVFRFPSVNSMEQI